MRYLKDTAFVIKRTNFSDSDRYITLFTKNHGKIEVVAKGVRKITSRRAPAIELLNLIEFQTVKTQKNYILTEVKILNTFSDLKLELKHMEKVFMMCELIEGIMPLGVKHEDVFDLMTRALPNVTNDEKTLVYFQAKLLSILGFWDKKNSFKDANHVSNFMEQILERKLKAQGFFKA